MDRRFSGSKVRAVPKIPDSPTQAFYFTDSNFRSVFGEPREDAGTKPVAGTRQGRWAPPWAPLSSPDILRRPSLRFASATPGVGQPLIAGKVGPVGLRAGWGQCPADSGLLLYPEH